MFKCNEYIDASGDSRCPMRLPGETACLCACG